MLRIRAREGAVDDVIVGLLVTAGFVVGIIIDMIPVALVLWLAGVI